MARRTEPPDDMAIYHCSIKIHSRGKGQSATAVAAYRSGDRLISERTGITSDYSHRKDVIFSEILLPEHIQKTHPEFVDRQTLWNSVDKAEKAVNAQFSREFEVALPKELTVDQMKDAVRDFAKGLMNQGMIVDWALHQPHKRLKEDEITEESNQNWHAHINCTLRRIGSDGSWEHKQRKDYAYATDAEGNKIKIPELDKDGNQKVRKRTRNGRVTTEKVWKRITVEENPLNSGTKEQRTAQTKKWRKDWEESVNRELEKAGRSERIDCRSLADQGIERIPQIHVGVATGEIRKKQKSNRNFRIRKYEWPITTKLKELLTNKVADPIKKILEKIQKHGMTRGYINEMIIRKNQAADELDEEIKKLKEELEKCRQNNDRDREEELYERLRQLRAARADYEARRRDAERDRGEGQRNQNSQRSDKGPEDSSTEETTRVHRGYK